MAERLPKCGKCGGNVIRDGSDRKCLQCGQEWKTNREKAAWYDDNRKDILEDIRELGSKATQKKWQMTSSTLTGCVMRWSLLNPESPVPVRTLATNVMLPGLPAFSDTWPENVQIRWLETYLAIFIHGIKEG